MSTPELTVAVASHGRALRLRWLLNALEDQTLPPGRFEVVVSHRADDEETAAVLRDHPLAASGVLRAIAGTDGSNSPAPYRNIAWRAGRAPHVIFTDDDCRPPRDWLERAREAARRHPGAVVQGRTLPDPEERALLAASFRHTQRIEPLQDVAQACNILYPRELLERVGGFDEALPWGGEDTDLAMRARKAGADYVGAPEMTTWHAVVPVSFPQAVRAELRWKDMPAVVKRHPELRRSFPLWIFFHRRHVWLPLALTGALLQRRNALWAALAIPWAVHAAPAHGMNPRGRLRALAELPARLVEDVAGVAALAWGSVRHRTLFL